MSEGRHDIVVVGAGPAGAACASLLASIGHDVAVVDGGPARYFPHGSLRHVLPGAPIDAGRLRVTGAAIVYAQACTQIDFDDRAQRFQIALRGNPGKLESRVVVVATGMITRLPAINGLDGAWNDRVISCQYCSEPGRFDRDIAILITAKFDTDALYSLHRRSPNARYLTNGLTLDAIAAAVPGLVEAAGSDRFVTGRVAQIETSASSAVVRFDDGAASAFEQIVLNAPVYSPNLSLLRPDMRKRLSLLAEGERTLVMAGECRLGPVLAAEAMADGVRAAKQMDRLVSKSKLCPRPAVAPGMEASSWRHHLKQIGEIPQRPMPSLDISSFAGDIQPIHDLEAAIVRLEETWRAARNGRGGSLDQFVSDAIAADRARYLDSFSWSRLSAPTRQRDLENACFSGRAYLWSLPFDERGYATGIFCAERLCELHRAICPDISHELRTIRMFIAPDAAGSGAILALPTSACIVEVLPAFGLRPRSWRPADQ